MILWKHIEDQQIKLKKIKNSSQKNWFQRMYRVDQTENMQSNSPHCTGSLPKSQIQLCCSPTILFC